MTGAEDHNNSLDRAMTAMYAGDVQSTLDDTAKERDDATKKLGVDEAWQSYLSFLKLTGSISRKTSAARGLAAKC